MTFSTLMIEPECTLQVGRTLEYLIPVGILECMIPEHMHGYVEWTPPGKVDSTRPTYLHSTRT